MTKRHDELVNHLLNCAGIEAVHIDRSGSIRFGETVTIDPLPSRSMVAFCYAATDRDRLLPAAEAAPADQLRAANRLWRYAEDRRIGISPYLDVVEKAVGTVDHVLRNIDAAQQLGTLREVNAAFRAARREDPTLRHRDYMHGYAMRLVELVARQRV